MGLAALALGALLSAALLEVGVLVLLGEQVRFPRHVVGAPFGVRINEPNARYQHRSADVRVDFRINARGMRADRDYAYAKPPGTKRIVALGDSFTAGYEVQVEETFAMQLEGHLRAAGHDVEVLNAGVSGYSNAEALLYLERELLKYEPDVVLLSFYGNDLVDNLRTGLFRLEGDELVQANQRYVPGGRIGDFLNTNPLFNFLSERSNAFVLVKERLTLLVKARMVRDNERNFDDAEAPEASPLAEPAPAEEEDVTGRLAGAIFQRMLETSRGAGARLVIQSIPARRHAPLRLLELLPEAHFDASQPGLTVYRALPDLEPHLQDELLYYDRSHGHWTPFAHRVAGQGLARTILEGGLLEGPSGSGAD